MTNSLFNLSGKVAAVSGAASGMGRAMLLALAEAGADVVAIDLNQEGARGVAREIKELGQKCHVAKCDVSNPDDIRAMLDFAKVKMALVKAAPHPQRTVILRAWWQGVQGGT